MRYIEKLEISKFRSFGSQEVIELLDLNVFSGGNDSGKSNILKALNLFFNNQTDINSPFKPLGDFNKWFRDNKERGQRKIKIKISFSKGNYKDPNGINKGFIAEKEFSDDGGIDVNFYHLNGILIKKSDDNLSYRKANAVISEKIRYIYIPTVRDSKFRENVQRLIEALALSTDKRFKEQNRKLKSSFDNLEENLSIQLTDLKKKIFDVMNINIRANVNFSTLLESLSFETDSDIEINKRKGNSEIQEIELKNRGEGIQMQFFSFLLWFISKNDTKHNYIWGYEEPEIAFEMKRQFELAENFFQNEFLNNVQILLTTHSPAFAFLEENKKSKIYRVAFSQDYSTKRVRKISKATPIEEYYNGLLKDLKDPNNKNIEYLQQDIWGINIQKISKIIGSSLDDVIKYRHFSKNEFEKIKINIEELSIEKINLEEKVNILEKNISKTYPKKIFICEDKDLVSFWKEILTKKCNISDVEIYSSEGCQNNQVEIAVEHLKKTKNGYNPIIFRQLDRDGYLDEQIDFLESKLEDKYNKFQKYKAKFLPVNEIENFGYLIDGRYDSQSIKNNFNLYESSNDAFLKTVQNNILAIQKKFQKNDSDKKIICQEKNMKKFARTDYIRFYPGKEFKKLNIRLNPISVIMDTNYEYYPEELKNYLQIIIDFFNGSN